MTKLQVVLDQVEADALARWANVEMRDVRDQIRFVLHLELERHGFLQAEEKALQPTHGQTSGVKLGQPGVTS